MEVVAVGLWLLAFLGLGALALPLAAWVLGDLDHAGFAIPIALVVLAIVGHLVGHVAFVLPALIAGLAAVGALSALAARRTDYDYGTDLRESWEFALVFVVAFLLIVLLRALDPAAAPLPLAIGEKFLDFGLLNTLDRAGRLPPEDMWFAGESVRYHYGGHLITTLVATLTGTEPALAYNLGLAGFYATLVTAAYGLAGSIARPYDVSQRIAAGLGAFFVGLAANLEPFGRVLVWLAPDSVADTIAGWFSLDERALGWSPGDFGYFDASRVIPIDPTAGDSPAAATEFPLFAWLNGDLHAHMMVQPFMLLAAGVLLAAWRGSTTRRRRVLFGALVPVVGVIGLVDLWSFPVVLGLTGVVVFALPGEPLIPWPDAVKAGGRVGRELQSLLTAVCVAFAVLVGALGLTLPYWLLVVAGGAGGSVQFWEPWTPLSPLLVVHGAFLLAIGVFLARMVTTHAPTVRERAGRVSTSLVFLLGVAGVAVTAILGAPALGLVAPLLLACWWLLRTVDEPPFELALVAAGAGLILLVELVTIEGERFNVIFKPYVHVWLFWSVATAVVLPRLAGATPSPPSVDTRRLRQHGAMIAVLLVVVTGVYAGLAVAHHLDDGPQTTGNGPTLDATAYLESEYPEEAEAIRWIDEREGQPTLLTAAPGSYYWDPDDGEGATAPASLTGVPTVLGWFHERQYRGDDPYETRLDAVETMYTGNASQQTALFDEYGVDYVYVGPAERNRYGSITVGDHDTVTVAHRSGSVTIYEVSR
ncbi:DUF2298 domain-containing protein [Halovenus marina]|uniref:DUF2298 domain-containing protein n=1 Tax=Halovenus marina TaxID=3396621 RepID=UPI003F5777C8